MPEYSNPADASSPDAAPEPMSDQNDRDLTPMTDDEVRDTLKKQIEDAESFIEQVISPQREEAARYYNGENFVENQQGRSNVVMTELRDVVTAMMPSFMRIFWGPERRVEFLPTSSEDIGQAEQETDYINDVVMVTDNPGFLHSYMWIKDALVKTTGVVKWWWDDTLTTTTHHVMNMSEEALSLVLSEDGVKLISATPHTDTINGVPTPLLDAEFTRTAPDGRARWMPLPPEEFGFNRGARSIEEADLVYHHSLRTTTELLDLGISQDDIDEYGGKSSRLIDNPERLQRDPTLTIPIETGESREEGSTEGFGPMDRHDYWETFPKIDANGDGRAELRKVCLLGPGKHVVENVPADERPFAMLVPDPEPHTVLGLSMFDYIADMQRISSFVFRGLLDSLTAHLNPRYEAVEDQVSIPDVLNHEIGAVIRVKQPNMVRVLPIEFVGANAIPVLDFIQSIKENRVGITKAAAGLNPDALQSSTKAAVAATVTAAQQRIELFARIFAETGFKQLMKGLRRLVIKHQPRARIVKLRGKYVEVDPRVWDADRDVTTNVALGLGFAEDKVATLGVIAADQKDWLEKLGPTNPLVTLGQLRSTMARILKLQGYANADEFYMPLDPKFQPPPAPQPQQAPDPAMIVAQSEVEKTKYEIQKLQADAVQKQQDSQQRASEVQQKMQNDLTIAQMKTQNDLQIALMNDDLEKAKLVSQVQLQRLELELKYNAQIEIAKFNADVQREKAEIDADTKERIAKSEPDSGPAPASPAPAPASASPSIAVHIPKQDAPHVEVHVPAPPASKKRKRTSTAKRNKDGSMTITSEESD